MNDITIENIQFLTPALVNYKINGESHTLEVSVDFKKNVIHMKPGDPPEIGKLFFPFLNKSLQIPNDAFEADEETYREAEEANERFEKTHREHVGENNE